MRDLFRMVDNFTGAVQRIVGLIIFGIITLGILFSLGVSFAVPRAANSLGESVERLGEKKLQTEREARQAESLANEGWGYGAPSDDRARDRRGPAGPADDGWAP